MLKKLDAREIANMFLAGAKNLQNKKEWINELNVFPVPDGDTGTNMTMTIMSAAEEINKIDDMDMTKLAKALSSGSLKGARGNSGVILSQLLRGFSKTIAEHDEVDVQLLTAGFVKASETAYKAVMKPKEGTILTVAREMSEKAVEIYEEVSDIEEFFKIVLDYGKKVLANTPELLPVLKEAGVVDSGGQGLIEVLNGAFAYMVGEEIDISNVSYDAGSYEGEARSRGEVSTADIKFGYCTEFIVMVDKEMDDYAKECFRNNLLSLGDSLVFVTDDDIIKVHIHTNHPGLAFEKALEHGSLTRMKVDNMREEHREIIAEEGYSVEEYAIDAKPHETLDYGFVSVSVGEGIGKIFKELGVQKVVEGGQTMNPSTQDLFEAIDAVDARTVFVFPNNKNIILAAQQAASVVKDKEVVVVPTTTIPQGISAIIAFDEEADTATNEELMTEAKKIVKSGEVTYSIRETHLDGFDIYKDDIMGIGDGSIKAVGKNLNETTIELIEHMIDDESGIISVYYGQEAKKEDIDELENLLMEKFVDLDIEVLEGLQPVYFYIVSVE